MCSIEDQVRTIIAFTLDVPPENIRVEVPLSIGVVGRQPLKSVAHFLGKHFNVAMPRELIEDWLTVGDAVADVEKALRADRRAA